MISAILFCPFYSTPVDNEEKTQNPMFARGIIKVKEVEKEVRYLAKKMGIENPEKVVLKILESTRLQAMSLKMRSEIFLSPLLLANPKELPASLQWKGRHHPRNMSCRHYVKHAQKVSRWIKQRFALEKFELTEKSLFDMSLFMRNSALAKKARLFLILHELAHLMQDDIQKNDVEDGPMKIALTINVLALATIFGAAYMFGLGLIFLYVATLGTEIAVSQLYDSKKQERLQELQREKEKDADIRAVKTCPKILKGGVYFFKTRLLYNRHLRKVDKLDSIDSSGNYLADLNHPKLKDRIKYLKKIAHSKNSH
ncbi:MAG: M48 family metalloprotease [Anaerolineae bacterium]